MSKLDCLFTFEIEDELNEIDIGYLRQRLIENFDCEVRDSIMLMTSETNTVHMIIKCLDITRRQ